MASERIRSIEIHEPVVSGHEVGFSWTVTPATTLYERTSFSLRFPDSVDLTRVPVSLWWRIALMCLHSHWPLLRPCRVELPVKLGPGEAEFWLRLTDAGVEALERHAGGADTDRKIELLELGPLSALSAVPGPRKGTVSCFSGGRDSTVSAAILAELGDEPTLVSVTSPVQWSNEHDTARRRDVLDQISCRGPFELVEVESDFRGSWDNLFGFARYETSVNELTDAFLYLGAAIAVAAARGAGLALMASEAELQESSKPGGMVIQPNHFMYSAATHQALASLLEPAGIAVGSLTNSLRQFQLQRLLAERYPQLRDLQYSCWSLGMDEAACSQCRECRAIALNLIASGVSPEAASIDLVKLLTALRDWEPGERYLAHAGNGTPLPRVTNGRAFEMQEIRCLAGATPETIVALMDGSHSPVERREALQIYTRLHDRARRIEVDPEPGYRAGYLEFVEARHRDGLREIIEQHFAPGPPESYAGQLDNTRLLARWIAAPLRASRPADSNHQHEPVPQGSETSPLPIRPEEGVELTDEQLGPVRELIPDPEPPLDAAPGGRIVPVATTLLDGNELKYVRECIEANWISSAGSFVPRLEQEFAAAIECRYAVACSSGTAALHLALAAAGVGPGDEVIVPAFTMIATATAVRYLGADPVLVDADPVSWNLDPERLADKLSPRTRAVIVVHIYGEPADMDAVNEFAARNGLVVIEDAAEAHGARYRGVPVGGIGAVGAFSLYGNKILTTGEGGIVTTNDERIAAVARELRDHAFSRERHFWHRRVGFNYRMTNLQAAVGVAQTERFEQLVARRRLSAERYRAALEGIPGVILPPGGEGSVNWMFGVRITPELGVSRDELRRALAAKGIETRTFFVPMHLQPIYYERFAGQRYPVAEELGRTGLYLPSGPDLKEEDIAYVADAVRASSGFSARTPSPS